MDVIWYIDTHEVLENHNSIEGIKLDNEPNRLYNFEFYFWGIDCIRSIDFDQFTQFINDFPEYMINLNDMETLRGIIGCFSAMYAITFEMIIEFPSAINVKIDENITRAKRDMERIEKIGEISNTEQAKILRSLYKRFRLIKRSKNLDEMKVAFEASRSLVDEIAKIAGHNVVIENKKGSQSFFSVDTIKKRILFGVSKYIHNRGHSKNLQSLLQFAQFIGR